MVSERPWTVQARSPGARWHVVTTPFATRAAAIEVALDLKAGGSEVLVRASTTLSVKDCPSQLALPGALVGRFSVCPVALLSRRARARLR